MQRAPECTDVPYIGTNYGQLDSCEPAESSTSGPLPRPCQTNQVNLINERWVAHQLSTHFFLFIPFILLYLLSNQNKKEALNTYSDIYIYAQIIHTVNRKSADLTASQCAFLFVNLCPTNSSSSHYHLLTAFPLNRLSARTVIFNNSFTLLCPLHAPSSNSKGPTHHTTKHRRETVGTTKTTDTFKEREENKTKKEATTSFDLFWTYPHQTHHHHWSKGQRRPVTNSTIPYRHLHTHSLNDAFLGPIAHTHARLHIPQSIP